MNTMNKFKSTVQIDDWTFVLDMNALATLEEITGKGAFEIIKYMELGNITISQLRAFYFACLKRHHPQITIEEAGDVFSDYPDAMDKVLESALPKQEGDEGNGKKTKSK